MVFSLKDLPVPALPLLLLFISANTGLTMAMLLLILLVLLAVVVGVRSSAAAAAAGSNPKQGLDSEQMSSRENSVDGEGMLSLLELLMVGCCCRCWPPPAAGIRENMGGQDSREHCGGNVMDID